jgi:hypothetical protein
MTEHRKNQLEWIMADRDTSKLLFGFVNKRKLSIIEKPMDNKLYLRIVDAVMKIVEEEG